MSVRFQLMLPEEDHGGLHSETGMNRHLPRLVTVQ
jgi:hypothetical protein